ncbi:EboA domain-containing protein [Streptomyces boncukensis]|uniref:Sugar phosphate isomerase n=1 Tax=Streptomyces boncukensis TaxID=2711219 RepID=A0A6G4X8S7_9ACTN|nr:EboA domain-containing protein [Streptomyces boncukensis]NGO73154.1 sugar phosphate isomerase [Streptomyces boncukensis]
MLTPLASLRTGLEVQLDARSRDWLHRALAEAADAPRAPGPGAAAGLPPWERHFATAGRHCAPAPGAAPADAAALTDTARVLLLHAAGPDAEALTRLYGHGSAAERRAVLLALPHLDPPPETSAALALVEDALRSNDTELITAALGSYAAAHLDAHQWRHGVLKCLFTGVPLSSVAELEGRARGDGELARMLSDYARERTAAGREVPADLHHALKLTEDPRTERP